MSSTLPLDVQNLFEDQIDSRIESAINRYDARSGEYPAVVTRKGSDGMWWCRVVGNEEETPIMTALTEMSIGDTIRLVIKDGRTTAQGNESAPAATSTSVNYVVQGSVAPLLNDIDDLKIGKIDVREFNAETAKINELMADKANITDLTAATGRITTLETNALTANSAVIQNMLVETAKVQNLTAAELEASSAYVAELIAEEILAEDLIVDHGVIMDLDVNYAKIENGLIVNADIDHAKIRGMETAYARIDAANITEAFMKQSWADTIMVQTGLLAKEGTVYSLDAIEVNAVNITAGTLDVDRLVMTINGEKYLFSGKDVFELTDDATLYTQSSTVYTYALTSDDEIDAEKTYYTYDSDTEEYTEVETPATEDISQYYEKFPPQFDSGSSFYEYVQTADAEIDAEKTYYTYDDVTGTYSAVQEPSADDLYSYYEKRRKETSPSTIYYTYDSVSGEYEIVEEPSEQDFNTYYQRVNPGKIYYEYDPSTNVYSPVAIPTENDLPTYYEKVDTSGYVKLDGDVLEDRTIAGDKILANSITASEITAENLEGTGGWINLASGTFKYMNAQTGSGIAWDGQYLTIFGGYTDEAANIRDVVGVDQWLHDNTSPTNDTVVVENHVYYHYVDGSMVKMELEQVNSVYSLSADEEVNQQKLYYEKTQEYAPTRDTTLDISKDYYVLVDGTYVLVSEPSEAELADYYEIVDVYTEVTYDGTENPSDLGWYEKGNPSLQGLYMLDQNLYSFLANHLFDSGDGTVLRDGGSGYSLKIAQDGLYIYDDGGQVIGKYGDNMQIGSLSGTHMIADENELAFLTKDGTKVAYIEVDERGESWFYMTRSVVVKDMFFGDGLWKWCKRDNNNMSLKWMGET